MFSIQHSYSKHASLHHEIIGNTNGKVRFENIRHLKTQGHNTMKNDTTSKKNDKRKLTTGTTTVMQDTRQEERSTLDIGNSNFLHTDLGNKEETGG